MDKDDKLSAAVAAVAIIVASGFLIKYPPESNSNHAPATKSPAEKATDNKVAAAALSAAMLRNMMKNPRSFDLDQATVSPTATTVCLTYYAQNGFGATSIRHAIVNDGNFRIEDPEEAPLYARAMRNPKEGVYLLTDYGVNLAPQTILSVEWLDKHGKYAEAQAELAVAIKGKSFAEAWSASCIQPGMDDVTSRAK
jgi:hypothetical protein